ncbi:MAG TPA: hypothetical protein VE621_04925 [Bryobacteraceae bacterium]|nr:hypothetical protein [Bryobacteraceae bacterium]
MALSLTCDRVIATIDSEPVSIDWSGGEETLTVVTRDGRISLVDERTGSVPSVVRVTSSCRTAIQCGKRFALLADEQTVIVRVNGNANTAIRVPRPVTQLAWQAGQSGVLILAGSELYRWCIHSESIATLPLGGGPHDWEGIAAPETSDRAVLANGGNLVASLDTGCGRFLWTISAPDPVTALVLSPNGRRLVLCGASAHAYFAHTYLWNGCQAPRPVSLAKLPGEPSCGQFRKQGGVFAIGCESGAVLVLRTGEGRELKAWDLGAPVRTIAWSPGGRRIAAATADGRLSILRVCR